MGADVFGKRSQRGGGEKRQTQKPNMFDWTATPPPPNLTPFQQFVRDVDWTQSPLGPMEFWPSQLRRMACLIMADPTPAVIYWGDDATVLYNEAYRHLIGQKHPALMGSDPAIGFAEVWDNFIPILEYGRQTGQTTVGDNQFLLLERQGFLEETYFNWKFIPIIGDEGEVVGSYATVVEATREVISDRRMVTVRNLGSDIALAKDVKELWPRILHGLEQNPHDAPLVLLYSLQADETPSSSQRSLNPPCRSSKCVLEGALGVPVGHAAAPLFLDLESDQGFAQPFRDAMGGESQFLRIEDGTLSEDLLRNMTWRGFSVPCRTAVVTPIQSTLSEDVLGFMLVGLNPRRPYNASYQAFLELLTRRVTTPHVSAIILSEEVRRRQEIVKQAAVDQAKLSAELSARTKDFEKSEAKFTTFAMRVPVGLVVLNAEAKVIYANEYWYKVTGNPPNGPEMDDWSWWDAVYPEDLAHVQAVWSNLMKDKSPVTFQTRLRKPPTSDEILDDGHLTWILCSAHVDVDQHGNIIQTVGCLVDITSQKAAEDVLRTRMTEALETKRQQENFIDMTSHEMRNPLAAILHSAEEIIESLKEIKKSGHSQGILDDMAQAAETILYCSNHQRRIVDDILTLSRLDSKLLQISPAPGQAILLIRNALKIFDAELKSADIKLSIVEDSSLRKLNVGWLMLDSGRVLQILINLITNAIKFTRSEAKRQITVTISASATRPSEHESAVNFVPTQPNTSRRGDDGLGIQSQDGKCLYFSLAVKDTGTGLTAEEKKILFNRFSQASPKTHTQYGGSGLGLFISRQLSEMQGGEIGLASEKGCGSTFMFYVRTKRVTPPEDAATLTTTIQTTMQIVSSVSDVQHLNGASTQHTSPAISPSETSADPAKSNLGNPTREPLRVLVVEDNLVNQKVVVKQLKKQGCMVDAVNHGEEALAFLRTTTFWKDAGPLAKPLTCVLMDCEMPVMDGPTAVAHIRRLESDGQIQGHVPVIAVTANAREDQIKSALEAGMDDVTTKPYRIADLLVQINKLTFKNLDYTNGNFLPTPFKGVP